MKHIRIIFGLMLLAGALGSTAMAQVQRTLVSGRGNDQSSRTFPSICCPVQRTFVSGLGNDGNPCSRTAPCRTFGQAILQTAAGGEVYVLDSAGYGAFTISQSVSIVAPAGVTAGISVFSGTGIVINTASSDTVILRGLTINNQGSSGNGISFSNQGTLHVENCVINGFSNSGGLGSDGLVFVPAGAAVLDVKDSTFRNNFIGINILGGTAHVEGCAVRGPGGGGILCSGGYLSVKDTTITDCLNGLSPFAISIQSSSGTTLNASMDHITVDNCGNGVSVQTSGTGSILGAILDSAISNCSGMGIAVAGGGSTFADLNVERTQVANVGTAGLSATAVGSFASMSISNCVISGNQTAYSINSSGGGLAQIFTRGNNTFVYNNPGTGSLSPISAQ